MPPYDPSAALEDHLGRLRAALGAGRVAVWLHEASTASVVPCSWMTRRPGA